LFPSTKAASQPSATSSLLPSPRIGGSQDDDDDRDPAILKFSSVGDSRQDPDSPDPATTPLSGQDALRLQNTKAFSRILDTIHEQTASLLFFDGDRIMGYGKAEVPVDTSTADKIVGSDLMKTCPHCAFWRGLVARSMETGTYGLPVAGNHEVQQKKPVKKAFVENENAWRANLSDLILDDARFASLVGEARTSENVGDSGGLDGLSRDRSQLSYSFDVTALHFAVINTDPVGKDGHAPTAWLGADLAAAKARRARRR